MISGRIQRQDCGRISDGAAVVFLASAQRARVSMRPITPASTSQLAYIRGWGHRTAPSPIRPRSMPAPASMPSPALIPILLAALLHIRATVQDAFKRAELTAASQLDGIETHDCFTSTEYLAIDHFGVTPPGQSWRAVEAGAIEFGGALPINPSGGLIGSGHPVARPACA